MPEQIERRNGRHDRSREIRLQTIMIGISLAILGFFGVEIINNGKSIVQTQEFDRLMNQRVTRIDNRVTILERR